MKERERESGKERERERERERKEIGFAIRKIPHEQPLVWRGLKVVPSSVKTCDRISKIVLFTL